MIAYTLEWGWTPPHYEKISNGNIRLFYYVEPLTKSSENVGSESSDNEFEDVLSWKCYVVELKDDLIIEMISENPESIGCQKMLLKEKILAYDSSELVNSFTIGGVKTWLDKATRVGLKLRFEAEKRLGKTETILWQNGMQFKLPLVGDVTAFDMLDGIELYASACYDVTQRHLAEASKLTTVEEMKNYDYIAGYPQKLSFG